MNTDKIEKIGLLIGGGFIISSGIAYGFATELSEFFRYFVLSMIALTGGYFWFTQKKRVDERVVTLEGLLQESDGVLMQKEQTIDEYEEILDDITVQIPCNCGENAFIGIFKPEVETVVQCEKCKTKYAIRLNIDKVLVSEPIEDLDIDGLIKKNVEI